MSSFANSESSGNSELEGELGTVESYQFEPSGSDSPAESDDSEDDDRLGNTDW